MNIKYRGREIQNPILRKVAFTLMTIWIVVFVTLMIISSPLWLLIHFLLRIAGLRGFIQTGDGEVSLIFTADSFKR